ncbi:hypothetical protein NX794_01230 [Streptomyces sp. LP11]|uniref:Uncharacterized protein n=1 Tax=Streptomyces pyxinicus TaxID=2970331 RepID=A0ABT2AW04_9ACTN|nr:hypothetical protein [Streptomyces sp. LP11]MCS0599868.1 hypothetical protein [Streptomyces sp. LP11]
MKFVLEVTVDDGAVARDRVGELERILRYWGGNLRHYELAPGDGSAVYDSAYQEVGAWRVEESGEGSVEES